MVIHRVYNKQLSDTIQARFTYENSPVFAGSDDFCLLLRLKHTDDTSNSNLPDAEKTANGTSKEASVNTSESQVSVSSFSSRLSTQLTNATRSLFLQTLDDSANTVSKTKAKIEKETLLLGYCQLLGHYSINETILDYSTFKDLQKETIIEGKYAGIQGLVAPSEMNDGNDSLLAGLNLLYNSELNTFADSNIADKMKFIPFFSSDQQIIFSEIQVDPSILDTSSDDIASFLITFKLPQHLPPSYTTESVQINYNFVFGYQVMDGLSVKSKTIFVPLKIWPYINSNGKQPIYHLEKINLNMRLDEFSCQNVSEHPSLTRKPILHDTVSGSRRVSFWNLKQKSVTTNTYDNVNFDAHKENQQTVDVSEPPLDNDVKQFLKTLETLNEANINNIIKVQEQFEKDQSRMRSLKFHVRENLLKILTDTKFLKHKQESEYDSDTEYEQILPNEQQAKFIIKQNHDSIATMRLNKGIVKLGDRIHMTIAFDQADYATTGIEVQLLKHQILRNDCIKKGTYDELPSRFNENVLETILFQKMMSTVNTSSVNAEVLIPLETEPQFKTNFFTCKYYVQVRFITTTRLSKTKRDSESLETSSVDRTDCQKKINFFKNIFVDSNGSMLFRAKERVTNSNEFYIRVPICVLPTYEQDFGFITTKL